jgi:hypothetical protein
VKGDGGGFGYEITGIHITKLHVQSFQVHTIPARGLKVDIVNLQLEVHLNTHFRRKKWPHISGHGHADVGTSNAGMDLQVALGVSGGKPTMSCITAAVHVGQYHIHYHGSWSLVVKILEHVFHSRIRHLVENAVDKGIRSAINKKGEAALQKLNLVRKLDHTAEVDFSLTDAPHFEANYFSVPQKAEFYWIEHHEEAPFPATPLPDLAGSGDFRMMVSDFVPNSAGYVYWKAGRLRYMLTEKDVPPSSPAQLNTGSFKATVPVLYEKFPNMKMKVDIIATSGPITKINPSRADVLWTGEMHVYVITSPTSSTKVATLGLEVSTAGRAWMQSVVFHAEVSYLHFKASVKDSLFGPVDIRPINDIIEYLCAKGIVPFLNTMMSSGIEVPVIDGFHLVHPAITFANGYVVIGTDLEYHHP